MYIIIIYLYQNFYYNLERKKTDSNAMIVKQYPSNTDVTDISEMMTDAYTLHYKIPNSSSNAANRYAYYYENRQGVPITSLFNAGILDKLQDPSVVEKTLCRLFGGNNDDDEI